MIQFFNPIRPMPVPQRHYPHKIVCQNYMNEVNGLSFHDFSSWTLLYPLKQSNFYYLYKIFEKSHLNIFGQPQFWVKNGQIWLDIELGRWFFACGFEFVHDEDQQA